MKMYSAFLKQGNIPIAFEESSIAREEKKGESRIAISNPQNVSEENNHPVPAKVYLHEITIKPEHRAEILDKFRPRPKTHKKQSAVRQRI